MTVILYGAYEPDNSSLFTNKTSYVANVVPRADGYGPIHAQVPFTSNLASRCLGYFSAISSDGTAYLFAGTATGLYRLNSTTRSWDNVSKSGGYTVQDRETWSFCQFGDTVIAVTSGNMPQSFTIGSSSLFADLAGSPPAARRVAIVGDFVVLVSLDSAPRKIRWSSINDPTGWTVGVRSCDEQEFPDGGFVRGLAGGEFGIVFQDNAIRRMIFAPGTDYIFEFSRISEDRGILQPFSLVKAHAVSFFLSSDGFYRVDGANVPIPIGASRVNRTLLADADLTSPRYMIGVSDPASSRLFWFYKSLSNTNPNVLDKAIIYDWALDRWSQCAMSIAFAAPCVPTGVSIETLDTLGSIEGITFSFDSFQNTPFSKLSVANTSGGIGFLDGDTLEAILDTPEGAIGDGVRTMVRGIAPFGDATSVQVSVRKRERIMDPEAQQEETGMSLRSGYAPQRASGRFITARCRIPAGVEWTYARGVDVDAAREGER